jgi:hypothetical protein
VGSVTPFLFRLVPLLSGLITKRIILDASVAVAWCFEDENTHFTEGVLDLLSTGTEVVTPAIWVF